MYSLADVEPEVLYLIAEFLDDSSPKSTKALACVNRYLNEITKLIAHRHKTVNIEQPISALSLIESWNDDDILATNIRTLTIKGHTKNMLAPRFDDEFWEPLIILLGKIGKLRQLNWNVQHSLPITVLDALERYQRASTLRIADFVRNSATEQDEEPDELEQRLARSPALTHIRLTSVYDGLRVNLRELAFKYIVGSAPNLVYAGLIGPKYAYPIPVVDPGDTAHIHAAFRTNKRPNSSVQQLTLDGFNISKTMLQQWSPFIDLSSLHNVKFSRGAPSLDYFQHAASMLPSLKHLSLNLILVRKSEEIEEREEMMKAVANCITTCPPLQTLSLWSWMEYVTLSEVLERHGETLERLQLHERDNGYRELLSTEDVINLRKCCPRLREFTFDLDRHDPRLRWETDVNKKYFEELAKFPYLETLQIYFDVGAEYLWTVNSQISYDYDEHSADEDETNDNVDNTNSEDNNNTQPTLSTTEVSNTTTTVQDDDDNDHHNDIVAPASVLAPKRRRPAHQRPSRDSYLKSYATNIWKTVFQHKSFGPRRLDMKVGDWEGMQFIFSHGAKFAEWNFRRHIVVRPHERDDVAEPSVVVHHQQAKSMYHGVRP